MDFLPLGWLGLGILAVGLVLAALQRRGWVDTSRERVRRGTGHAFLGLQEFIAPSVEHIIEAQHVEQKDEGDREAGDDDREAIEGDLAASLARGTIDSEEVRRHLAAAARAGLDWRAVYERAARAELAARPFKAPSLPPEWRVAPRE
jgi:hypothetical protein